MDDATTIETLRRAAQAIRTASDLDAVRAIQAAQDALDTEKAMRLAAIEQAAAYEVDGMSSLTTWSRLELRLSAAETKALVRASSTLKQLPALAKAAADGLVRSAHVNVFSYGLKHIGFEIIEQSEPWLLDVAKTCEPAELVKVMKTLREAIYPDELDKAWARGMDKHDIQVVALPDGWQVTGFLDTTTGAKLKAVLDSVSKPRDKDDSRSGPERRIQGLDELLSTTLESGLPSDKGVRPHMSVIVDAETLGEALAHQPGITKPGSGAPAQLVGFGPIGPQLLSYLGCLTDFTPILTQKTGDFSPSRVLDVGRSHRCATLKQRRAIIARQEGVCAAPGCTNSHLEIHHSIWWSNGGTTDLDLLVGLCTRCHHLVHRGVLRVSGTGRGGFNFTKEDNRPLLAADRQRRAAYRETGNIRRIARAINANRARPLIALRT